MATLGDSTITNLTVLNNITGKGSGITNLNASNLSSGSIGKITYDGKITVDAITSSLQGILVTNTSDQINKVTDAATIRTLIGAGTSSLALVSSGGDYGSATTAARSDHKHGNITNAGKVTTEETTAGNISKLLITNSDGTIKTAAVSKAIPTITVDATNGVSYTAAGASSASATYKYTHPTTTAVAAAAVKVGNDSNGHVVLGGALTKSDVGLGNVNNTAITVSSTDGVSDGTNTYKYTLPSDVVQDSSYNHITVTSTSVSDGTNTFNKYSHPTTTAVTAGLYKVGKDSNGHVELGDAFTIPAAANNASHIIQLNGTTIGSNFTANASSNITTNIQAMPNFSLSIGSTNAGNPRQVKFLSINYSSYDGNNAAYFKLSATCCHGNGISYQFLEDIIIGCSMNGDVTCNVFKHCQSATTLDNIERAYGDIFYTIDTNNKVVDFYILVGQYSTSNFTPYTRIGATVTTGITQLTGTPVYYSSGTKYWATGNNGTYSRTQIIDYRS